MKIFPWTVPRAKPEKGLPWLPSVKGEKIHPLLHCCPLRREERDETARKCCAQNVSYCYWFSLSILKNLGFSRKWINLNWQLILLLFLSLLVWLFVCFPLHLFVGQFREFRREIRLKKAPSTCKQTSPTWPIGNFALSSRSCSVWLLCD